MNTKQLKEEFEEMWETQHMTEDRIWSFIEHSLTKAVEEERERVIEEMNDLLDEAYEVYGGGLFPPDIASTNRAVVVQIKNRLSKLKSNH